jgi:hypothetical protein
MVIDYLLFGSPTSAARRFRIADCDLSVMSAMAPREFPFP